MFALDMQRNTSEYIEMANIVKTNNIISSSNNSVLSYFASILLGFKNRLEKLCGDQSDSSARVFRSLFWKDILDYINSFVLLNAYFNM